MSLKENYVDPKTGVKYKYTSGKMESTVTAPYGVITFLASMPYGPGLQPGLWLHAKNPPGETLPDSFELDLCEFAGKKNYFYSTCHKYDHGVATTKYSVGVGPCPDPRIGSGINNVPWNIDVTKANLYTALWRPGEVIFFFNLKPYADVKASWIGSRPMVIKMQLKNLGQAKSWQTGTPPDKAVMKIYTMGVYTGKDAMRMPSPAVPKLPVPVPR